MASPQDGQRTNRRPIIGTKYANIAVSGYNSSPPPDDGTTGAANQVTWAKHKQKIGDPLNTAIAAINTALVTALDQSVRAVSAADTTLASDHDKTIQIASTVTASILISLGDAAAMAAGYIVTVSNQSAVACQVDCITATDTINNSTAAVAIASLESITFIINSAANGYIIQSRARTRGTTTNDAAVAGEVGEYISASVAQGAEVSLVNSTAKNVTSISLTAGDWDVSGIVLFFAGNTTVVGGNGAFVSAVSNTQDFTPGRAAWAGYPPSYTPRNLYHNSLTIPQFRLSLATTTTYYLVAISEFTTSTQGACGFIGARRAR